LVSRTNPRAGSSFKVLFARWSCTVIGCEYLVNKSSKSLSSKVDFPTWLPPISSARLSLFNEMRDQISSGLNVPDSTDVNVRHPFVPGDPQQSDGDLASPHHQFRIARRQQLVHRSRGEALERPEHHLGVLLGGHRLGGGVESGACRLDQACLDRAKRGGR
jgi:hypothetical protein